MEAGGERFVDGEAVRRLDVLALRGLDKDTLAVLAHGEGQQGAHQVALRDHRLLK